MKTAENATLELVTGKQSTDNYPYGSLKCTMTFEIEFKPNKGFRFVTQSINPKTGRLNKPKASTYSDFMFMTKNSENGHFAYLGGMITGHESISKFISLVEQFQIELPEDQREFIYINMINSLRISYAYTKVQFDNNFELYKTVSRLGAIVELLKSKAPLMDLLKIGFDSEKIKTFKI